MARTTSRPCHLQSCNNPVNLNNYPNGYCYLHQNIPNRILLIKEMPLSEYNRRVRHFDPSGSMSFAQTMVQDLSARDSFPIDTAKTLVADYFSRGNLSIPDVSRRITDADLERTAAAMRSSKAWKSADLVVVKDGKTAGPNGVLSGTEDRVVIFGESTDTSSYGRFVIDPRIATAAHTENDRRPVDDEYQSGVTPFGDGVYVDRVYRYCDSNAMKFDRIESMDGHLLYKRPPDDSRHNVEFEDNARAMIEKFGVPPAPPVIYDRKPVNKEIKIVDRFVAMSAAAKSYTEESEYYEDDKPRRDR